MSDNTKQARWMFILWGNLAAWYRDDPDVFVAVNLLWYARELSPEVRAAPDVFVAMGRPKGDRGSYKQWEEGGVAPQVVFEVLSPGNTPLGLADTLAFYDEHGVEEYYLYDPDSNRLLSYRRGREALRRVWPPEALVSPRLGIRFDLSGPEMVVYHPNGERFLTFEQLTAERHKERLRADHAERQAAEARQRLSRLAELGRKARLQQASPDELAELEHLEAEASSAP
jgi:Uma2 family endonuclease